MKLSVVIPAKDEEENIGACIDRVRGVLDGAGDIPYELVIVDDDSSDRTAEVVAERSRASSAVRLVRRGAPSGFGRAVRTGLDAVSGDVVVLFMADLCDDPSDLVRYYRKIGEGYDCVFGSRFVPGASVASYPLVKLFLNRLGNHGVRLAFGTELNDLTNAFKAYRAEVLRECGPFEADHFEITLELSLSALVAGCSVAQIPIGWAGRTSGQSKLRLWSMGGRYLKMISRMRRRRRERARCGPRGSESEREAGEPSRAGALPEAAGVTSGPRPSSR
jgi:dolichol-phosphate mannosyltransferase